MAAQTSFKDIIMKFEDFANDHKQINQFGWGEVYEINPKDILFPYFHVLPISSRKEGSLHTLTIKVYVLDLQDQDNKNLLDISNQMFMIGNDIISEFEYNSDMYGFEVDERNIIGNPVTGEFDQHLSGWVWDIPVTFMQTNNCSNIPK